MFKFFTEPIFHFSLLSRNDASEFYYNCIWDITLLEFVVRILKMFFDAMADLLNVTKFHPFLCRHGSQVSH